MGVGLQVGLLVPDAGRVREKVRDGDAEEVPDRLCVMVKYVERVNVTDVVRLEGEGVRDAVAVVDRPLEAEGVAVSEGGEQDGVLEGPEEDRERLMVEEREDEGVGDGEEETRAEGDQEKVVVRDGDEEGAGLGLRESEREKVGVGDGEREWVAVGEGEGEREGLAVGLDGVLEWVRVGGNVWVELGEGLALEVDDMEEEADAVNVTVATRVTEGVVVMVMEGRKVLDTVRLGEGGESVAEGDWLGLTVGARLALALRLRLAVGVREWVVLMEQLQETEWAVAVERVGVGKGEHVGLIVAVGDWVAVELGVDVQEREGLREEDAEGDPVAQSEADAVGERDAVPVTVEGVREVVGVWDAGLDVGVAVRVPERESVPLVRVLERVRDVGVMVAVPRLRVWVRLNVGLWVAVDFVGVCEWPEREGVETDGVMVAVGGDGVKLVQVQEAALGVGLVSFVRLLVRETEGRLMVGVWEVGVAESERSDGVLLLQLGLMGVGLRVCEGVWDREAVGDREAERLPLGEARREAERVRVEEAEWVWVGAREALSVGDAVAVQDVTVGVGVATGGRLRERVRVVDAVAERVERVRLGVTVAEGLGLAVWLVVRVGLGDGVRLRLWDLLPVGVAEGDEAVADRVANAVAVAVGVAERPGVRVGVCVAEAETVGCGVAVHVKVRDSYAEREAVGVAGDGVMETVEGVGLAVRLGLRLGGLGEAEAVSDPEGDGVRVCDTERARDCEADRECAAVEVREAVGVGEWLEVALCTCDRLCVGVRLGGPVQLRVTDGDDDADRVPVLWVREREGVAEGVHDWEQLRLGVVAVAVREPVGLGAVPVRVAEIERLPVAVGV